MALTQTELDSDIPPLQRTCKESPNGVAEKVFRGNFVFGQYLLDAQERRLWHAGECVSLPSRTFDLLLVFVQHAGQLLEKEALLHKVWSGSFVEEANLSVHVSALRKAFAKDPEAADYIETIPKWGYRFTATVTTPGPALAPLPSAETEIAVSAAIETGTRRIRVRLKETLLFLSLALLGSLLTILLVLRPRDRAVLGQETANSRPLTSLPGVFSQPAFSFRR
jgi:DNA-binding winged helix-turn-helix (wHTH) protein